MELKDDELRSIEGDVLSVSLQLILFLNAGLVVSSAFEKLIDINKDNNRLLYKYLREIANNCKEKNLSFINEFFLFAQATRSRSLMRFAGLVLDNKSKGSSLADKLEKDRAQMQNSRVNTARSKAKEAETKLCFPLMLLLVALITICSAPALMQI